MISSGRPDASAKALRLRLDWLNAYKNDNLGLTPYVSLTWFHSHIDGYTETGGGFPVQWNSRNEHTSQGRLGMDGHSSNASGTILGLSNFELTGITTARTGFA